MPTPTNIPDLTKIDSGVNGDRLIPSDLVTPPSSGSLDFGTNASNLIVGNAAVTQLTVPDALNPNQVTGHLPTPTSSATSPTPSNSAPSTAQTAQQTQNILQSLGGLQNPLNNYYQMQPLFKLFMTQDIDPFTVSSSGTSGASGIYGKLNSMKNVILAQTGVTGYNINSVEIESQVGGPSSFGIMTHSQHFTITISEAMGTGFPEALLAAAQTLGIKNHLKSFIYLQLQFIAYDTMGNIVTDPVGPTLSIPNLWIWQISIVDIDVHIAAGGGTYTITAIPLTETTYDPAFSTIPEACVVTGTTLQAITDTLATALNKSWFDRYGNTVTTYAFKWHKLSETLQGNFVAPDDPSTYPTNFTDQDFNTLEGLAYSSNDTSFTFHNSIDIPTFLNAVIHNTKYMQALGKDYPTDGSTPLGQAGFRKSIQWMIEPDVQLTGKFETYTQQYYKTITYHIRPYYTQRPIIDKKHPQDAAQPGVSLQAMQDIVKQKLLKKRYDYIYTGLNIDVIDFDIHYNYQWNAILSRFVGRLVNKEQLAPSARVATATQTNPSGPAGPQAVLQNPMNQISTDQLQSDFTSAQDAEATAQNALSTLQQQSAPAADIATAQNNLTTAQANTAQARTAYSQRIAASSTPGNQVMLSNGSMTYAESLINAPVTSMPSITNPSSGMNVSIVQADKSVDDMSGSGNYQDNDIDKSVFAACTGQLCMPQAYQFMTINLTIRGDPYWLPQTNLVRADYMRNNTVPPENSPDTLVGDNCFLLHFRTPISIGNDFTPTFRDSLVFNGLYAVTNTKSIFGSDGFKQELTGQRLMLIDTAQAASGGAGAASGSSPVTDYNGSGSPSPSTSSAPSTTGSSSGGSSSAGVDWYNSPQAAPYKDTIDQASQQYNVPAPLLAWQLGQESSFNPNATNSYQTSSGQPTGIAQFTTGTAQDVPNFGPLDPTDPNASIMAAAAYDSHLYSQTGSWQGAFTKYGTLSGNPSQATWNGFNNALQQSNLAPGA